MRRALTFLALFILAAFCTACGTMEGNTNASLQQQYAKIIVEYPDLFLQDEPGKVTFELEKVAQDFIPITTSNGNSTRTIDTTDDNIWPQTDPDKYDVYVEVQLIPTGLTKIDLSAPEGPYKGGRQVWEWSLKPTEGAAEGAEVSFRFQVDVTWKPKDPSVKDPNVKAQTLTDKFKRIFRMNVGPPASRVNAAFYASPVMAFGGLFTVGVGIRRRKKLAGAELEEGDSVGIGSTVVNSTIVAGTVVEEPEPEEEEVSSTVYAPRRAGRGDSFMVQVVVHLPEEAATLDEVARMADEDAERRGTSKLQQKIKRGTELTFCLTMPGLDIDDPVQSCVWSGDPAWVQFGVAVPEDCKPGNIMGTVTVSEASVPIGHLKFMFKIAGGAAGETDPPVRELFPAGTMTRYRQAFISYASENRSEVLKRVQMLNLAKIKFFQDLLTLEPGDQWEKLLYDYIDKSDVFFLFWSKAASESEWVRREVEYAIKHKTDQEESGPEIIPVIIEGPPPAKPPTELSFLHFNDKLIYFINPREIEAKPLDG